MTFDYIDGISLYFDLCVPPEVPPSPFSWHTKIKIKGDLISIGSLTYLKPSDNRATEKMSDMETILNIERAAEKQMQVRNDKTLKTYIYLSRPCNYPNSLKPSDVAYRERWPSSKHLELHTENPYF